MNTPSNEVTKKPQAHVHKALIKLWADGAKIQYSQSGIHWADDPHPHWGFLFYRVAPKPKVKKYRYVFADDTGSLGVSRHHYLDGSITVGTLGYKAIQRIDSAMIEVDDE